MEPVSGNAQTDHLCSAVGSSTLSTFPLPVPKKRVRDHGGCPTRREGEEMGTAWEDQGGDFQAMLELPIARASESSIRSPNERGNFLDWGNLTEEELAALLKLRASLLVFLSAPKTAP
jgi:hypothetical protein